MSHPETPTPSSPTPSSFEPKPEPSRSATGVQPLRREALVATSDRGRLGILVALCSLAGVVVGFGLSNMAASMRAYHCPALHASGVQVVAAPIETPTWLGVRITTDHRGGAYVQQVEPASPASAAGIQPGDVIMGFAHDGCVSQMRPVHNARELVRMVRSADVGDRATVALRRSGEKRMVRVSLDRMPVSLYLEER